MSAGAPTISFWIPGLPRSTQTGTVIRAGGRAIPLRRGTAWSAVCGLIAAQHRPDKLLTGPLEVTLEFLFPRPKRTKQAVPMTRDVENLSKGPLDAWQGVLYVNDNQIADLHVKKRWADERGPGLAVTVMMAAEWTRMHGTPQTD